jgi:hypothetical protein
MSEKVIRFITLIAVLAALAASGAAASNELTTMRMVPGLFDEGGYITGPGEEDEFTLETEYGTLVLTFYWSEGMDAYCKVYSNHGDLLGEFRLADSNLVEVNGVGLFNIVVGSYAGGGDWRCEYKE